MSDPFIVFKVAWLTKTPGEEHRRSEIIDHFYCIIKFLQDNSLVVRQLITSKDELTDDFALSSSDLTEDGLALMRAAYHKWLAKVDKGMPPQDVTLLEKALKKIRGA
ncbi:hypothetical protein ASD89_23755 [Caulobacter sp. Root656]|nr:hypothetical protein ASD89_23755 [Caulobacter sp. Root656]